MNEYVESLYIRENDLWGLPQEYKKIKFYPIKIDESKNKQQLSMLLSLPKMYVREKVIIKMSYLKYILVVIQNQLNEKNIDLVKELTTFLSSITRIEEDKISIIGSSEDNTLESLKIMIKIDGIDFYEDDFDNLREIILAQNGTDINYIEEYEPDLEEKMTIFTKGNDLTFEEEVVIFCSLSGKTFSEVKEYTIYQFKHQFRRMLLIHNFNLYKPLELKGQIKAKNGGEIVKDYLSHLKNEGRYDGLLISKDEFVAKNSEIFDNS